MRQKERLQKFQYDSQQLMLSLSTANSDLVLHSEKIYRLQDMSKATYSWEKAYSATGLGEEESFIRYVIAGKSLVALRRARGLISSSQDEQIKARLLEKSKELVNSLSTVLLSLNSIEEPEALLSLEREVGDIPLAAMLQNVRTLTNELPKMIGQLFACSGESDVIEEILMSNGRWNVEEILEQLQEKRTVLVTAMSSGAMIMPFFVEALKRMGFAIELEVFCPVLDSPRSSDRFIFTPKIVTPQSTSNFPEIILVLDDVVNHGHTISLMNNAVVQKYGSHIPIISGTAELL